MGHRFEKLITLQFGVVTGFLIVVGGAEYSSLNGAAAYARRAQRAHEALSAIDQVLALVTDAETGQRGYLLTGRDVYRAPFDRASRNLGPRLDALKELLGPDPTRLALLEALRGPINEKMAELKATIDSREQGLDAALPEVFSDRGKRLMDEIRAQIARMRADEQAVVTALTAQARDITRSAMTVSVTAMTLTLAVLWFAFRVIRAELAARRRVQADLSSLAAIIASTDDAVIGKTLDGVITSWNAAAERLFGYPAAEAIGRDADPLLNFDHDLDETGEGRQGSVGKQIGQVEVVRRRKDGTVVDVEIRVSPIRDEAGATVGYSTIARDVTTRKRAEVLLREKTDALESARARLAAAAEFAAALNQSGMLETYRATLGCLARVARAPLAVLYDVVEGAPPQARCAVGPDLMPLESATLQGDGLPASVAQGGAPLELAGPFGDPALRTRFGLGDVDLQSVLGWPVSFRGRTLGVLVTAHSAPVDSERRGFITAALEQLAVRMDGYQVEQHRVRLLADLQAQSRALESARLDAVRANRAKSEFLAAMSHELRTPMNSIMGFTARLLRKLGPTLDLRELDALQTVDRNAKHLLGLINDILDLSKIEAGKMDAHAEPFDLATLAREAASQSAALFDTKPVELVLNLPDGPVEVEADPKLIKQVVLNLLSNASKFTDRGTVTISAGSVCDSAIGDAVRVAVSDTGIGIKAVDRDKLFQRFSQLDGSPSRKVGGTGLGLALADRMVRLQGGRIDVASEPGKGSEFAVVLPRFARDRQIEAADQVEPPPPPIATPEPSGEENSESSGEGDPRGVTILCVDDEPDALKYLQLTFEDAGYNVFTAASHDEAVLGASVHRPDLICLDLSMPGKDGFAVVRSLRADPAVADVPILVVSATSEESRALRAGARRYLAKPAEAGALVEAVHELLGAEAGDVLLVEDDADACRLAADALTERGLHVRTAGNGREALKKMAEAPPAAIVLDLMMPVMDGFAFLARLGRDPAWRAIPVVVMTARSLEPAEASALNRACVAVLAKGKGDTEQLVEAVLNALRPRSAARPAETVPA